MVGGKIIEIAAAENAKVSKGDQLFRIDPEPYRQVVEQTEADLGIAIAALDTRRRALATEESNAKIASEQTKRAQTNYELSDTHRRTVATASRQGLRADPAIRSSSNGET